MNRKKMYASLLLAVNSIILTSRVRVRPSFQVVSEASGASARVSARSSLQLLAHLNNNNFKIHHVYPPPPPNSLYANFG